MEERLQFQRLGEASCRNLRWLLDVCAECEVPAEEILKDIPYSFEHLSDPSCFIDWRSYRVFIRNFRDFLSVDELAEFARIKYREAPQRPGLATRDLFYNLQEQYVRLYRAGGLVEQLYPCRASLHEIGPGNVTVTIRMLDAAGSADGPSRTHISSDTADAFHYVLLGQMRGLPETIGGEPARVTLEVHDGQAIYRVGFVNGGGSLRLFRRLLWDPLHAVVSFTRLAVRYRVLASRYEAVAEELGNLREDHARATEDSERYRLAVIEANDVVWTLAGDRSIDYLSPSMQALSGYTVDEARTAGLKGLFTPLSFQRIHEGLSADRLKTVTPGQIDHLELEMRRKDASLIWLEVRVRYLLDADGSLQNLIGVCRDITRRKTTELALKEREASWRAITDGAEDGILTFGTDGTIDFANPAAARILCTPTGTLDGTDVARFVPALERADRRVDIALAERGDSFAGAEFDGRRGDGTHVPLEISIARHEGSRDAVYTAILRDASHRREAEVARKELERQLLASQKMESIGQLTGGIAHDFNNLLVAILGYADLALAETGKPARTESAALRDYLVEIREAGKRAANMTQQLLAFSRRQIIEPAVIDVSGLLDELLSLIRRLLPQDIQVTCETPDEPISVLADRGQIEQVVINLAVNARDAMSGGGNLLIQTTPVELSPGFAVQHPWARAGHFLRLRVRDDGCGMSPDVTQRVFEPFFTTKPEGSGTGLGLAVVFGIVNQHGGLVDLDSKAGQGTTIDIYLPLAETPAPVANESQGSPRTVSEGRERVLVVEDNAQVRELARLTLRGAGYDVMLARDGEEAIDTFSTHADAIDLVIMDVVLPRQGGRKVMEQIRALRPTIKLLFTSGYPEGGLHTGFIRDQGLAFLQKPYSTSTLRGVVRGILDEHPSSS